MSIEVVIALALILCFCLGWYFYTKNETTVTPADTKSVVLDFEAKKKAEATRIDAESPSDLRDDFNRK